MSSIKQEDLINILPIDGPPIDQVSKYIKKYKDDIIVIKYGGNVLIDRNFFNTTSLTIFSLIAVLIIAKQKLEKAPEIISANFPFKHFSNLPEYIDKDIISELYMILIIAFALNIFLSFLLTYLFGKGYKTIQFLTILMNLSIMIIMIYSISPQG